MKKLTQKEVEQRFKDRNLILLEQYNGSGTIVKIQCFCGKTFATQPNAIFTGHTTSCGCLFEHAQDHKLANLVNKNFGSLKVISRSHFIRDNRNKKIKFWNCLCSCGKLCKICQQHLVT